MWLYWGIKTGFSLIIPNIILTKQIYTKLLLPWFQYFLFVSYCKTVTLAEHQMTIWAVDMRRLLIWTSSSKIAQYFCVWHSRESRQIIYVLNIGIFLQNNSQSHSPSDKWAGRYLIKNIMKCNAHTIVTYEWPVLHSCNQVSHGRNSTSQSHRTMPWTTHYPE